jgi:hypothetical protein
MSDEASDLPTVDQILSALENTGFLLEYRVAQKLQELKFYAYLNHPFVDPESKKTREIDVLAEIYNNVREGGFPKVMVHASLIVECKNYRDPLLVIGQEDQKIYHNDQPIITFDPLQYSFARKHTGNSAGIRFELRLGDLPSNCTQGFIASQLIKMNRNHGSWQASNDSIYDSIVYPLAKASQNETAEIANVGDDDPDAKPWHLPSFEYIFPILVTSAKIFAVDVVPNGTPTVRQVKWTPLVRYFSDGAFLMDVVSFDSLAEYVHSRVTPALEETKRAIASKIQFFNPEWLQEQYGESSSSEFGEWLDDSRSSD